MRKRILFLFGLGAMVLGLIFQVFSTSFVQANTVNHLLISEIYYDTIGSDNDEEWLEIHNPADETVDMSNYKIGDEETMGEGEGMYIFPPETRIDSHGTIVVAKDAVGFYSLYGKYPDFEITSSDDDISDFSSTKDLQKYSDWASGSLSLTNSGDEVLLLDEGDNVVDVVVYEEGEYGGLTPHPGVASGNSLERHSKDNDTNDCSIDFVEEVSPSPGYDWIYEGENYFNSIGTLANAVDATNGLFWEAKSQNNEPGFMFYGPYTSEQTEGMYQVSFRLRVNENSSSDNVVRIDARNQDGSGLWVFKDVKGTDFDSPDKWQNFNLWFRRLEEGSMEYRVWFYDNQDVDFDNVMVSKVDRIIYETEDLRHNTGQEVIDENYSGGKAWQATAGDSINHMIYGPYHDLSKGNYELKMVAKIDDNSAANNVARLDIYNIFGTDEYKYIDIAPVEFKTNNQWQEFDLYFSRNDSGLMEYRVFFEGGVTLTVDNIILINRDRTRYESENLFLSSGQLIGDETASSNKAVQALTNDHDSGWVAYGPYTKDQLGGEYQACFNVKTADNTISAPVVRINAYNSGGDGLEVDRDIAGTEFSASDEWQEFCLPFTRTNEGTMEYRLWFYDVTDIAFDYVEVKAI